MWKFFTSHKVLSILSGDPSNPSSVSTLLSPYLRAHPKRKCKLKQKGGVFWSRSPLPLPPPHPHLPLHPLLRVLPSKARALVSRIAITIPRVWQGTKPDRGIRILTHLRIYTWTWILCGFSPLSKRIFFPLGWYSGCLLVPHCARWSVKLELLKKGHNIPILMCCFE